MLSIRDFVIVDAMELEFAAGFTALTGETGAGKSILIDALALALGDRGDASVVRAGCERAEIAAEFDITRLPELGRWLSEAELEGDAGVMLLRRTVDGSGRSRAFINGRPATLAQLREAGNWVVDIHGQHEHQSLLRPEVQRNLLDAHAGLADLALEVGTAYRAWQKLARTLRDYATDVAQRDAEREQLAWQLQELERLALQPGEWEAVQAEQSRLAHAASLIEGVQEALNALSEAELSGVSQVSGALARLEGLLAYDAAIAEPVELMRSGLAQMQEAVYALRRYADKAELDPARLASVEARMEAIHASARKFRCAPEGLLDLAANIRARLAELELAGNLDALQQEEQRAHAEYDRLAAKLSSGRRKAATKLAREVSQAMQALAMQGGRFEVAIEPLAGEAGGAYGNERVEFRVAANKSLEARALAKIASGGELSRISLALQVTAIDASAIPTLIFDEVDAGIGGAVAEVVGRRLKALGAQRQVLCVTHLPQVAARADQQWSVRKSAIRDKVTTAVAVLNARERVEELARMLGGSEITALTRKHAAEMLSLS